MRNFDYEIESESDPEFVRDLEEERGSIQNELLELGITPYRNEAGLWMDASVGDIRENNMQSRSLGSLVKVIKREEGLPSYSSRVKHALNRLREIDTLIDDNDEEEHSFELTK